jgi:hypothetical protein
VGKDLEEGDGIVKLGKEGVNMQVLAKGTPDVP